MKATLLKLGVFAVVAVTLTGLLWSTLRGAVDGPTRTYVAEFTDVSGLRAGDDVRVAGVRVGRVDDLRLAATGTTAEVTFTMQADQPIFANTRAVVRYQNLIGQRFLAMVPGAGPSTPLPDGARIPIERTRPPFDLTALLNGFEPLFSVLEPAEINRLSETIIAVLQGSGPALRPLLDQTAELTNEIADRDEIIGAVLVNLSAVLDQLAGKGPEFDALLTQTQRLVTGLSERTDVVFGSVERVHRFVGTANDLVVDVRPALRTDLERFNQVAGLFLDRSPVLEETLEDFPGFLAALARPSQYGSWVNLYACTVDFQAPGVPPGALPESALPESALPESALPESALSMLAGDQHTEVCR